MTCIAWDGVTLAADKRAVSSGHASTVTKIERISTGELLAVSGDFDMGRALIEWYKAGASKISYPNNRSGSDDPRATLMVISTCGNVVKYQCEPLPLCFEDKIYAMGSGRDYALAAMHLGHGARAAVEVACALDTGCGNGIDTLELA